jgi:hypothetical protein
VQDPVERAVAPAQVVGQVAVVVPEAAQVVVLVVAAAVVAQISSPIERALLKRAPFFCWLRIGKGLHGAENGPRIIRSGFRKKASDQRRTGVLTPFLTASC